MQYTRLRSYQCYKLLSLSHINSCKKSRVRGHVTNRALGSEVWSQRETDEDICQGEADEDI